MNHSRTLRLAALAGTVMVTALILAACGSSSNTSSSSSSSAAASGSSASGTAATRSKFVACLKAHGVTLPSRPAGARRRPKGGGEGAGPPAGGGGGGFFFGGGGNGGQGSGRFSNPKMRAALQACGAGRFPQRRVTPNKAAVTKFVTCVKQHGYKLPAPNFSGKGPVFPASIERDKKFQTAARACASDLRAPGGSGTASPSGAGGGGSGSGSRSD